MFAFRDSREGDVSRLRVDVAFTDSSLDLQGLREDFPELLARVEDTVGVPLARLSQVHGDEVLVVDAPMPLGAVPDGDALVTTTRGLGLMVRVADCVPVVLADAEAGVVGAVHSGRPGMVLDIATRTVEVMRAQGATDLVAWLGPHVCGSCYEVPEQMRAEVCEVVPEAYAETSWGTPALDIGAGVRAQLEREGVEVVDVAGCTLEERGLHSYRRDGAAAGRFAGLVWLS
ncbi:polyphenol oxidase family protein [Nocardioides sp. Soil805]|uniref:polyphenol oxidase family protein n=1 Tax=Nocardioides sp. Soil805 TaxID=1736416 RepID=UPI000702EEEA|nr:polyphenol oxidase family protein [Nocardioides sp. Soil805]KRF36226.1 laccase [Nocardioides sp. Soil805]